MPTIFWILWSLVIGQRMIELAIAKRNGKRLLQMGGYEAGAGHYKYLVALHVFFFAALAVETSLLHTEPPVWWPAACLLFGAAQVLRIWCISSLGVHWNTRIYVLPGMNRVRRGPYRWISHPNYVVVSLELLTLPLMFGAYMTAAVVTLGNIIVLRHRISVEEAALNAASLQP
ncbi:isoprenylcysteine carboxyl methyltransferase family protein [Paenibacillus thalictri]|uniref:Isoprenylcysteine carboxyl methyltransferase n=1 Tax=Paenibacillus thalictri TaxID=2527873 RepID=A0A4Q9DYS6_9BACL|nr:isoprenylcysteine carboxylmethyltransferase family protein [Paenibacillus thalictri]TBL80390.1 isoprenylcysteine carboxyl methyltransferase [Paenibacillus thalictri]